MDRSAHSPEPQKPTADSIGEHPDGPGASSAPGPDYADGVPTFDFVRDRIEGRYAAARGTTELAAESAAGRSAAEQYDDREKAARERLEKIRRSLREE
jgi:phage shock protein A